MFMLDDKVIGSKAMDVETKIVSDKKSAGEGPTCDCLCDTFFQFDENTNSMLGPLIACNRGYGKESILSLPAPKNYKVITIASKIGSEHPIVGSTVVESYIEKIKKNNISNSQQSISDLQSNYGVLHKSVGSFWKSIEPFTMSDDPAQLLGPELKVDNHQEKWTFYAVGYHDIFDKKVEQKLLCFFLYGFPNVEYLFNTWVCIPKGGILVPIKQLFNRSVGHEDNNTH